MAPIQTDTNGRSQAGRFGPGNQFAKGHSSKGKQLRTAVLRAISEEDIQGIVLILIDKAIDGDLGAAKLILTTIGQAEDAPATSPTINQHNFEEIKRELLARAN